MKMYGNLTNRLMEGAQTVQEIKVGTGVTEISYSDRTPFEVVAVRDQKHITIREMGYKLVGEAFTNQWELFSVESNPHYELEKRGETWYYTSTITRDDIKDIDDDTPENWDWKLRLCLAGFDINKIKEKGKQTKRRKANILIGFADKYFDYEF